MPVTARNIDQVPSGHSHEPSESYANAAALAVSSDAEIAKAFFFRPGINSQALFSLGWTEEPVLGHECSLHGAVQKWLPIIPAIQALGQLGLLGVCSEKRVAEGSTEYVGNIKWLGLGGGLWFTTFKRGSYINVELIGDFWDGNDANGTKQVLPYLLFPYVRILRTLFIAAA